MGAPGGPASQWLPHPHSLCDHRDFLPVLLHGPLQLSVTVGPEAAIGQVQVSPRRCPPPPGGAARRGPAPLPFFGLASLVSRLLVPEAPSPAWTMVLRTSSLSRGPSLARRGQASLAHSVLAGAPGLRSRAERGSGWWFSGLPLPASHSSSGPVGMAWMRVGPRQGWQGRAMWMHTLLVQTWVGVGGSPARGLVWF